MKAIVVFLGNVVAGAAMAAAMLLIGYGLLIGLQLLLWMF